MKKINLTILSILLALVFMIISCKEPIEEKFTFDATIAQEIKQGEKVDINISSKNEFSLEDFDFEVNDEKIAKVENGMCFEDNLQKRCKYIQRNKYKSNRKFT